MKTSILYACMVAMCAIIARPSSSQTVSPVIVEYQEKGEGKLELTNSSLTPMVVVIEPKSFSITPDGTGVYRPLDPSIHVQLSSMSMRLLPKQSYTVFYKATADKLPAWFTIYSAFSALQHGPGVSMRILLPHTVYLYQKRPLTKEAIRVSNLSYDASRKHVVFDIENDGTSYGRVRSGSVLAGHDSVDVGGFPLLPGNPRHIDVAWKSDRMPQQVRVAFDNFEVKEAIESPPDSKPSP